MALQLANLAFSTLAASIADDDTTITIQAGDAAKFPALDPGDWFPLVVTHGTALEIMHCTAHSDATLTVTRGAEDTTGLAFEAGARVGLRLTAAAIEAFAADTINSDDLVEGSTQLLMTAAERSKLGGIAAGATANSSDATLLNRANHTGQDEISDVNGLAAALDGKAPLNNPTFTGAVTLPADPATALQAATKQYVDALLANVGRRSRVRVATTGNVTISTALNNGDSIDGVTLANGDLVLVRAQNTASQNGVYVVAASPYRFSEFDEYDEFPGSLIGVAEGTANGDTLWFCTNNKGGTLGSTAIVFSQLRVAGELLAANNLSDVQSAAAAFAAIKQAATASDSGAVELATNAETQTGSDATRAVTPAGLASLTATTTRAGLLEKATDAELRAATADKAITADLIESASAPGTLDDAATVGVDWDAFVNADLVITANRLMGNPTNVQPGTSRSFWVFGDSATERSLTWASNYVGPLPEETVTNTKGLLITLIARTTSYIDVTWKVSGS